MAVKVGIPSDGCGGGALVANLARAHRNPSFWGANSASCRLLGGVGKVPAVWSGRCHAAGLLRLVSTQPPVWVQAWSTIGIVQEREVIGRE